MIEVEKAKIKPEELKAAYDRMVAQGGMQVPVDPPKLPDTPATPDAAINRPQTNPTKANHLRRKHQKPEAAKPKLPSPMPKRRLR